MTSKLKFYFSSRDQANLLLHTLVWLIFFSIPIYNFVFNQLELSFNLLIFILLYICVFYFNFAILVPLYMIQKRWISFFFVLGLLFLIHCLIFFQIEPFMPVSGKGHQIPKEIQDEINTSIFFKIFPGILLFILIISVSSFLKIYEFWNENIKRQKEIEAENKTVELNFLKSQLNPHFFFNSLNTIYSLSISKSEKTSEAIITLSDLMRYMLIDKRDNMIDRKVRLVDELEYIANYIELQKLRITSNNKIDFIVEGKDNNVKIYPLLFISFIENAFKFGIHPIDETKIVIFFKIEKHTLIFEAVNNIHFQKKSYDSFGLGNENSIKRLNLYYPNNKLKIESTEKYSVSLKLELNEN